jgi:hypothetical protein
VDGGEDLNPENTISVLNTVLNTVNNEFNHECLDEAVWLLSAHLISQSINNNVTSNKYSGPGLLRMKFLAHQVWPVWFIVSRWVCNIDMPGALVADKMSLGKTLTFVAATIICTLLTEKV